MNRLARVAVTKIRLNRSHLSAVVLNSNGFEPMFSPFLLKPIFVFLL